MTGDPRFDARLRAWLDEEGPQELPDRVLEAAFAEAAASDRRRPLPGAVAEALDRLDALARGLPMPMAGARLVLAAAIGALLATVLLLVGALLLDGQFGRRNGPIAFEQGGDIWLMELGSGRPAERLTDTPGVIEGEPVWSPDGARLAYWVTEGPTAEIHVWDPDRGTIIIGDPDGFVLPLRAGIFGWSPDGTRIAVPAQGSLRVDGVLQVGLDTTVVIDIATRAATAIDVGTPAWSFGWSPDGRHLGLVTEDDVLVLEEATGARQAIASAASPDDAVHPFWLADAPPRFSPDGATVYYTSSPAAGPTVGAPQKGIRTDGDIHAVPIADASGAVRSIEGVTNDLSPAISPDGSRIAFARTRSETTSGAFEFDARANPDTGGADLGSDLLVAHLDGSEPQVVATRVWPRARWSPDGRRIVARSFDGRELVIVTPGDRRAEVRLAVGDADGPIGGFDWGRRKP